MRKTFMTKEYSREYIKGTMNMKEQKSFFMSKILEIEDFMNISNIVLTWTESTDSSQKIKAETITQTYNSTIHKNNNHSIEIAPNQTENDIKTYTSWLLKINIKDILIEYIFANLKFNRVFDYVSPNLTLSGNIKTAIIEYIEYNVLPRVEFYKINLYVSYNEIISNNYKYKPVYELYSENMNLDTINNYRIITDTLQNKAELTFKQTQSSQDYMFKYYFDVVWKKS